VSRVLQLMAAIGVVGSNSLVLSPIASQVSDSFVGYDATDVMVASAFFGLGTAASALAIAPKADAFGLARALRYSLLALLIGLLLSGIAPVLWVLCLGQAIAGLASGVTLPCTYSLAAEIAPAGRENETLGRVLLGWTLSMVIGISVSSFLTDSLHWRAVYFLLVACAGFVLYKTASLLPSDRPEKAPTASLQSNTPWQALKIPCVGGGLLAVSLFMMAFYGVYGFLGTQLTVVLKHSTLFGGFAAVTYGIGFGAVAPLDKWMDRYGAISSRAVVFTLLVVVYLALASASGSGVALLCLCFVWGGANHFALNLLVAKLTAISETRRAAIMGLYSAVTYLSMFVGTLLFKWLYENNGFSIVGLVAAFLILPVAVLSVMTVIKQQRKTPPA